MNSARRRTAAAWGAATLSVAVLLVTVPATVMAAAANLEGAAAPAGAGHRAVTRSGTASPAPERRVVTHPQDTKASAAAAAEAVTAAAAGSGSTSYSYTSQAGDYIGQGRSRTYTPSTDMTVAVTGDRNHISLFVHDTAFSTWWSVDLSAGAGDTLHPGTYLNAERDAFRTGRSPGLDANGEGRGCNEIYGRFTVNQIGFDAAGALAMADVTFVQRCETSTAPTYTGTIHLNQFPLSYRQASDAGDYVGGGVTKTYLNSTSLIEVQGAATGFSLSASGLRDWWSGSFSPPSGETFVVGRTYQTTRFADATHAGLDVTGNGRGCNTSTGTLTIQSLEVTDGRISHLRAVFEQHCEGSAPALRGTLRYFA
jgi:hypothetical protein